MTTKTKLTLEGYAPGVKRYFRVKATHREISSPWSAIAVIYEAGESIELELAA